MITKYMLSTSTMEPSDAPSLLILITVNVTIRLILS